MRVEDIALLLGLAAVALYLSSNEAEAAFLPEGYPDMTDMKFPRELQTSQAGKDAIVSHEGVRDTAYPDKGFSIGIGHHIMKGDALYYMGLIPDHVWLAVGDGSYVLSIEGRGIVQTLRLSQQQITDIFISDLQTVEAAIRSLVKVPLSQSMFDALADFVFNLGAGNFQGSTLLAHLNAGNYDAAANEFDRWVYSEGKQNPVLIARRADNKAVFSA
jgi:lysozyme